MKFCTKCGRPLKDNEVCNCTQRQEWQQINQKYNNQDNQPAGQQISQQDNQSVGQQMNQQSVQPSAGIHKSNIIYSVAGNILNLIKSPVYFGKKYTSGSNLITAIVLIVLQSLFTGFVALIICSKAQSYISQVFNLTGIAGSILKSTLQTPALDIPIASSFAFTILISLSLTVILAVLLFIGCKVIKSGISFGQILCIVSVRSLFVTIISIITCIVLFINITAGLNLFFAGSTIGFIFMAKAFPAIDNNRSDSMVYVIAIVYLIFAAIMWLVVTNCWQIYFPDTVRTGLKQIKSQFSGKNILNILKDILT